MANGESLFSYKARTAKTTAAASKPHSRAKEPTPKPPTKPHDRAKTPTPLTKAEQWLKDNPPNRQGIVDEVKSMLNPRNLTGANAIEAAIKGKGMSTTKRITTGLSGVVQGLGFAAGGETGKPAVEKINKIVNPTPKLDWQMDRFLSKTYWSPKTEIAHPTDANISYTAAVKPVNPSATRHSPRKLDKGYTVEVSRYDANNINQIFDSSKEYNALVGNKIPTENLPTSSQLIKDLPTPKKPIKNLNRAKAKAEKIIKKDTKK
jgi:hypothetical protein